MISTRPQTIFAEDSEGEQVSVRRTRLGIGIAILCTLLVFGIIGFFVIKNVELSQAASMEVSMKPDSISAPKSMSFDQALQDFYVRKDLAALRNAAKLMPQRMKIIIGVSFGTLLIFLSTIIFILVYKTTRSEALLSVVSETPHEEPPPAKAGYSDEDGSSSYLNIIISVGVVAGVIVLGVVGFFLYKKCTADGTTTSFGLCGPEEPMIPVDELLKVVANVKTEIALKKRVVCSTEYYKVERNRCFWWLPFDLNGSVTFKNNQAYTLAEFNIAFQVNYGVYRAPNLFIIYKSWPKAESKSSHYIAASTKNLEPAVAKHTVVGVDHLKFVVADEDDLKELGPVERRGFLELMNEILSILVDFNKADDK
jgi:hypothetical protein